MWVRDAADRPGEVWMGTLGDRGIDNAHAITHENDAAIATFALHPAEDFWYTGAGGDRVHGFLVKPRDYCCRCSGRCEHRVGRARLEPRQPGFCNRRNSRRGGRARGPFAVSGQRCPG